MIVLKPKVFKYSNVLAILSYVSAIVMFRAHIRHRV